MKPKEPPGREARSIFLLSMLAAAELFIAGIVTLLLARDPKNAVLFGFSPSRLVLVGGIWVLAILVAAGGYVAWKKNTAADTLWLAGRGKTLRWFVYGLSFLLIIWGWLALFCSPDLFGRRMYIFQRLQPVSVAVGVILAQGWIFFLFSHGRFNFHGEARRAVQRYIRPALLFAAALVAVEIFIIASRFGLMSNIIGIYADVVGIPLAGLQWFLIVLAGSMWIALIWPMDQGQPFIRFLNRYRVIPILLFLAALLTWGLTPMASHFFSPSPAAPSYQPFPFSDARIYDEGGISILRGYGVYFHIMIDKPLYMILLAALHGIAGADYRLLLWLQIVILAFIPVALYCLGRRFHSQALGLVLALMVIIRQRNAMVLSNKVSSINPKLLMSEEVTLLVMILIVYLAFRWIRERKIWQAVMCGSLIAVGALLRLNPLFLFPVLAVLVLPLFWGQGKKFLFRHLTAYTMAFIVVLLPWLLGSVDGQGTPWLITRARMVMEQRYVNSTPPAQPGGGVITSPSNPLPGNTPMPPGDVASPPQAQSTTLPGGAGRRFFYHFLHNYSTSVMALPMSLGYTDLGQMTQRPYWQDTSGWQGGLTLIELGFIIINLLFVSVGLAYAWKKFRWAGMAPLVIYLGYDLSLGFAMDSGGRYLVPFDWILYFYYFLGILALARFGLSHLTGRNGTETTIVEPAAIIRPKEERRALSLSIGLALFLAVLFPLANSILPALHSPIQGRADITEAAAAIAGHEPPGTKVTYGEVLYPYYHEGKLNFDLITPTGPSSYWVAQPGELMSQLQNGGHVFVSAQSDAEGVPQVRSIYLWRGMTPELIWRDEP